MPLSAVKCYVFIWSILRNAGTFGIVDVAWEIREALTNRLMYDGGEFGKANGTVRFQENDVNQFLEVTPRMDNTPEEDKNFKVILTYTTSRQHFELFCLCQ